MEPSYTHGQQRKLVPDAFRRLGDDPVRIDWYGDIVLRTHHARTTPYVQLSCTRHPASSSAGLLLEESESVSIPVSLIGAVRLGDVWQRGEVIGATPLDRVTFNDIAVNHASTAVIPAGLATSEADGSRRYELPFSEFSRHARHTGSFLARVDLLNGTVLLVPSMEIVRFYFGASGSLLSTMFAGVQADTQLYSGAFRDGASGVARLTLAPGLPGVAAPTVARIAFDKAAWRQYRSIINSGVQAAVKRERWYPRVGFPIDGTTTITADGVWIDRETDRAFVVHRLLTCSHPFPFSKLFYRAQATGRGRASGDSGATGDPPRPGRGEPLRMDDSVESARGLSPELISLPADGESVDVPFPDLARKPVRKVRDAAQPGPRKPAASDDRASDDGDQHRGTAQNSGGGGRAADPIVASAEVDSSLEIPSLVQELLDETLSWGVRTSVRFCAPGGSGYVSRLSLSPCDRAGLIVWASQLTFTAADAVAAEALVLVADPLNRFGDVGMVVFKIDSTQPVSEQLCVELASAVWFSKKSDFDVGKCKLIGAMPWSRLDRESAGVAQLMVLDSLLR